MNAKILNQVVDVSFENCHEHSFQGSFEKKFDKVLEKLQLEHPCYSKQMTEYFEGLHASYNLVADYI